MTADDVASVVDEAGVEQVVVEFPDVDGVARSKRLDADYFLEKFDEGFSMNMLLLAVSSVTDVPEESGLGALGEPRHLATDVWTRRRARRYVRHFFHATVHDPRDRWTHTVTGEGEETGAEYEFSWVELPNADDFALALDDYVDLLS